MERGAGQTIESRQGVAHPPRTMVGSGEEQATTRLVSRAVKRAQEGDREALGFLYARYADNVCGYVRSIVHDQHEAEDITQHVFAKLIHVIGKYEERDVPFFAWILRVSRNVAVDHIRRRRAIPVEEVRTTHGDRSDYAGAERMRDLQEALASSRATSARCLSCATSFADGDRRADGSLGGVGPWAASPWAPGADG